ncbi:MAG: SEC-C metal-binding domain-containing protein [Gammaproteobacteria bacterium]|nr:SEC-C metal-binding domain-containing protein [Gammaproteobacteria bacterium]
MKVGRNAPCPCGSGRKYKHCCLAKSAEMPQAYKLLIALIVLIFVVGIIMAVSTFVSHDSVTGPRQGQVWSEEHQHWH